MLYTTKKKAKGDKEIMSLSFCQPKNITHIFVIFVSLLDEFHREINERGKKTFFIIIFQITKTKKYYLNRSRITWAKSQEIVTTWLLYSLQYPVPYSKSYTSDLAFSVRYLALM